MTPLPPIIRAFEDLGLEYSLFHVHDPIDHNKSRLKLSYYQSIGTTYTLGDSRLPKITEFFKGPYNRGSLLDDLQLKVKKFNVGDRGYFFNPRFLEKRFKD